MAQKTNAIRLLDAHKISYELREYPTNIPDISAKGVADYLSIPLETIYKTLVLEDDKKEHLVVVIAGNAQVDFKKIAKLIGRKKVELLPQKKLLGLTGYVHGGCSPIGMKKKLPTLIDQSAKDLETITISGGKIGLQLLINPTDLANFLDAPFVDIAV